MFMTNCWSFDKKDHEKWLSQGTSTAKLLIKFKVASFNSHKSFIQVVETKRWRVMRYIENLITNNFMDTQQVL